ncbi:hypothetical protein [Cellulosimicrobium sp. Marseille-Q4280]|uniref:hypothetical protein n=1 Tax=Cellulosimicrobium sp. Marseille-Q4280 TaxID=2937992 RepID=UPI00203E03B4|nr:hypothetical protein [Cellulosimicrobium sp. Marseille-Q4280]
MATYINDRATGARRDQRCDPCTTFDEYGHPLPVTEGGEPRAWTPFDLETACAGCGASINRAIIRTQEPDQRSYWVSAGDLRAGDIADLDPLIPSTLVDVQPLPDYHVRLTSNEGHVETVRRPDTVVVYPRDPGRTR